MSKEYPTIGDLKLSMNMKQANFLRKYIHNVDIRLVHIDVKQAISELSLSLEELEEEVKINTKELNMYRRVEKKVDATYSKDAISADEITDELILDTQTVSDMQKIGHNTDVPVNEYLGVLQRDEEKIEKNIKDDTKEIEGIQKWINTLKKGEARCLKSKE